MISNNKQRSEMIKKISKQINIRVEFYVFFGKKVEFYVLKMNLWFNSNHILKYNYFT